MHLPCCAPSISSLARPQIQVDDIASSTAVGSPSRRRRPPPPSYSTTTTSSAPPPSPTSGTLAPSSPSRTRRPSPRLLFSARDDPCAFDETLSFTWHDAFRPHLKHAAASLRFEKATLVFNVGAAASRIAAVHSRAMEEGVRAACGEFQRAAGAFRAVGELMEEEEETTVDMSSQASVMLERLMLAQAQECC